MRLGPLLLTVSAETIRIVLLLAALTACTRSVPPEPPIVVVLSCRQDAGLDR